MRLLHLIPSLNPEYGGTVEGLKQLAAALTVQGHQVEIATLDVPGSPWGNMASVPVHDLGPGKLNYRYSGKLVPWLRDNARNFDAVIVEGLWQFPGYAARKALRGLGIPYFVFAHGMLDPWFRQTYPLKHLKKWLYWPWAEYRVLRDANAVLFTSEEEKILARQSFWLYRCREAVVSYGAAAPAGNLAQQREAFYAAYPDLRGKRLLLFLSRIHEKKGCDMLTEAFARIAARDPALHLVMAGPDQTGLKKDLVSLSKRSGAEHRITWTGMISGDLKWGAYAAADAFILPSHQENFGMVVAEALACGVPVLISDKVNIWREVEADGAGMVAPDTLAGSVELLEKWLELDATARAAMRQRAAACFASRFDMAQVARNLSAIIGECREPV